MKKIALMLVMAVVAAFVFTGCSKNRPYVTTITPSMTADIGGGYKYIASAVRPATIDTQRFDTSTTLLITGYSADPASSKDKIVLSISNYKGETGTFSMVQGLGGAVYTHGSMEDPALGGIIAITEVTTTTVSGYFNFNTASGVVVTNGKFTVGVPY